MEDPPARSAHEAYRRFFEAFNSRSPGAWAGTLHFPHVRIAPGGPIRVIDTLAEHIAGMSWDAVDATGWDHTVEVEPEIVHSGPSRVHIAGGWTRFTKANQPILSTRVTYIVTKLQDDWAIQSRFAVDGGDGNEAEAASERVARRMKRATIHRSCDVAQLPGRAGAPGANRDVERSGCPH